MLRGVIIEDALPSAARLSNSSRGLPAKDIIEYVAPEIQISCLKQSLNDEKSKDQLLALDEQGVSNQSRGSTSRKHEPLPPSSVSTSQIDG